MGRPNSSESGLNSYNILILLDSLWVTRDNRAYRAEGSLGRGFGLGRQSSCCALIAFQPGRLLATQFRLQRPNLGERNVLEMAKRIAQLA
jgi:hypothetical protein